MQKGSLYDSYLAYWGEKQKMRFWTILTCFITLHLTEATDMSADNVSYLVITTSLNPQSNSAIMAREAYEMLKLGGQDVEWLDLRNYDLPFCNGIGQSAYSAPLVKEVHDKILKADGILLASPIYNYSISAAAKNLIELTTTSYKDILSGKAWKNKVVGFIGGCGTPNSLLAPLGVLGGLVVDSQITLVPGYVLGTRDDVPEGKISDKMKGRLQALVQNFQKHTQGLASNRN
jgi:FMN reductase